MGFNQILRETRENKNLSLSQLAEKVGVSKQALHGYEKGFLTPRPVVLVEIAKALEVSTDYLLGMEQ